MAQGLTETLPNEVVLIAIQFAILVPIDAVYSLFCYLAVFRSP